MIKIYNITDANLDLMLNDEGKAYFEEIRQAMVDGFIPCVKIIQEGARNSWYNKHVGELYVIHKLLIDTDNGYINYIVNSRKDGTLKGYKPQFSSFHMGKGHDIVHAVSCEISLGVAQVQVSGTIKV